MKKFIILSCLSSLFSGSLLASSNLIRGDGGCVWPKPKWEPKPAPIPKIPDIVKTTKK